MLEILAKPYIDYIDQAIQVFKVVHLEGCVYAYLEVVYSLSQREPRYVHNFERPLILQQHLRQPIHMLSRLFQMPAIIRHPDIKKQSAPMLLHVPMQGLNNKVAILSRNYEHLGRVASQFGGDPTAWTEKCAQMEVVPGVAAWLNVGRA